MLLKKVILHEIGHYWFHNCADDADLKKDPIYGKNKIDYLRNDPERNKFINEWIAQMFAYLCLTDPTEKNFMVKFAQKQPGAYKSFTDNLNLDIKEFKEVAGLLKLKKVYCYVAEDYTAETFYKKFKDKLDEIKKIAETTTLTGFIEASTLLCDAEKYNL